MTGSEIADRLWQGVLAAVPASESGREDSLTSSLSRTIAGHIAEEESSIAAHSELVEAVADPAARAVLTELIRDEARHHEMFSRMAEQFAYEAAPWSHSPEFGAQASGEHATTDPQAAKRVRDLRNHEHHSARHMRRLADKSREEYSGLLSLMFEAIAMDSKKHEKRLSFVEQRLTDQG
jgi:rubrerythrin